MARLNGKVAIVTGAARGQGEMHALLCAKEGAKVVLADILDEEGQELERKMRRQDLAATYVHLDVAKQDDWRRAVDSTISEYGGLNVLVNNAAINLVKPIEEMREEEWDYTISVNAKGAFLGIKHAIPAMREARGGSIINISSVAGIRASLIKDSAYASSKGAISALTKTIAVQYAGEKIRCNCIYPAHIDTPMLTLSHPDPKKYQAVPGHVPLGRIGTVEEVAHAVVYLASDESSFVTGADLVIDGGMAARYA